MSEEVTGIDLVREQLRIADGEELGYDDPAAARALDRVPDQRRGRRAAASCPPRASSPSSARRPGPGVRLDSGVVAGDVIGGAFDSMLAKLIVTGRDRQQALERSRRALAEFVVEGMPTVLPFHRAVVSRPGLRARRRDSRSRVHTRWIETEFDNTIEPYAGPVAAAPEADGERQSVVVEVGGKRLEVVLPGGLSLGGGGGGGAAKKAPKRSGGARSGAAALGGDALTAPMQGTIVKIAVEEGQQVAAGDLVVVLEAMKMEQPITAHKAGHRHRAEGDGRPDGHQRRGPRRHRRLSQPASGDGRAPALPNAPVPARAAAWGPAPATARPGTGGLRARPAPGGVGSGGGGPGVGIGSGTGSGDGSGLRARLGGNTSAAIVRP